MRVCARGDGHTGSNLEHIRSNCHLLYCTQWFQNGSLCVFMSKCFGLLLFVQGSEHVTCRHTQKKRFSCVCSHFIWSANPFSLTAACIFGPLMVVHTLCHFPPADGRIISCLDGFFLTSRLKRLAKFWYLVAFLTFLRQRLCCGFENVKTEKHQKTIRSQGRTGWWVLWAKREQPQVLFLAWRKADFQSFTFGTHQMSFSKKEEIYNDSSWHGCWKTLVKSASYCSGNKLEQSPLSFKWFSSSFYTELLTVSVASQPSSLVAVRRLWKVNVAVQPWLAGDHKSSLAEGARSN